MITIIPQSNSLLVSNIVQQILYILDFERKCEIFISMILPVLGLLLLDKLGNKIGQTSFSSNEISNPSLIPVSDGVMIGFSDGDNNFNMVTMKSYP